MHALEEYGVMHVKLYEDIARLRPHRHDLRLSGAWWRSPPDVVPRRSPHSTIRSCDRCPALQLFGAGREKRIYAIPPYTRRRQPRFRGSPVSGPEPGGAVRPLRRRATASLTRSSSTTRAARMFVCSDTDHCGKRRAAGHVGSGLSVRRSGSSRGEHERRTAAVGGRWPRQALWRAHRLPRCQLRALAGRGAGGGRRVGLGQVDPAELPVDAAFAVERQGSLPAARRADGGAR